MSGDGQKDMHNLEETLEALIGELRSIVAPTPATMDQVGRTMLVVLDSIASIASQLERVSVICEQTAFLLPDSATEDDHDARAEQAQAALTQSMRSAARQLQSWISKNHTPLTDDRLLELLDVYVPDEDEQPRWRVVSQDYGNAETHFLSDWLTREAAWVRARSAAAQVPIGQRVDVVDLEAPDAAPLVSFPGTDDGHLL